jgi:hypothetical protein
LGLARSGLVAFPERMNMQTTEIYTRADPSVKLEALESVLPPKLRSGRFKATDKLIASLRAAPFMRSKKPQNDLLPGLSETDSA